ncbi:17158_t:CDS:2 [Dentiscutata erythropus]|uniref:17158_t:CDS:1 n=1 Tax=Dentiscutata erythropus TaxID=1348616 RepID=A0A9N9FG50_9GLOM|nr:17158_t:CDS:2 [Dentiscutata erythropus]
MLRLYCKYRPPNLKWPECLKNNQIRQNHFDSKAYQACHISFARFVLYGLVGSVASIYSIQNYNDLQTLRSFFNTELPPVRDDIFKERREIERISGIMQPMSDNPNYYLIIGPHEVLKKAEYMSKNQKTLKDLAKTINYPKFDVNLIECLSYQLTGTSHSYKFYWQNVLSRFEEFASKVAKKYSIHPILIIDDIAEISERDVEELQNIAKTAADHRLYTVVFIASDANLIKNFMKNSSYSRCATLYIGDFSKDEALAYLTNNCKMDTQMAKRIFDLCGGRISHIVSVVSVIDKLINKRKILGKRVDYNDDEFREEVIKKIDERISMIKDVYRIAWDAYIPEKSKPTILEFICNNLDANFTRGDIIRLFEDEEKGEYIFSTLLRNNIITYNVGAIEFGAPIIKAMFTELCEKRTRKLLSFNI